MIKIALIGSFRAENYPRVQETLNAFKDAGIDVLSPAGTSIISGVEFVRFETDRETASDALIQTETLAKIFEADAVYVVTGIAGYVGKTTCYEIGRIVQRGQPLYFSEMPDDLPVHIPSAHVVSPDEFVVRFVRNSETLSGLFESGAGEIFDGERRLAVASTIKQEGAFPAAEVGYLRQHGVCAGDGSSSKDTV